MSAVAPVIVCRTSELTEVGSFYTVDVASVPILVVRDGRGTIRAFINLCRHRGVRLVHDKTGVTRTFTCLMHGWTYDAEGQMGGAVVARLARDNPMLAALQTTNALVPLPSELRHGFVWVATSPRATIDVAAHLGALDADLTARGVEHYVVRERSEVALAPTPEPDAIAYELSTDLVFVVGPKAISVVAHHERRAETDFGERTNEDVPPSRTLERLVLVPPH